MELQFHPGLRLGLVYGRSLDGITGSNPATGLEVVSCECCLLSGRGLCGGSIRRSPTECGVSE